MTMLSSCMALIDSLAGLPLDDVDPLDIEVAKEERLSEYLEYELMVVLDCACVKRYIDSSIVGVSGKPSGVSSCGPIRSGKWSA